MSLLAELRGFVLTHRSCGVLRGNRDQESSAGYRVWIACPCGARFERWLAAHDADTEVLRSELQMSEDRRR